MGDHHSRQQEETEHVVDPQFVQTSNGEIDVQSGCEKLPVELLLLIFQHGDSQIRARLILTHTCRRWRLIAINYPHLWTSLCIMTHGRSSVVRYERFESFFNMQVDRSGGLPLDVVWIMDTLDQYATHAIRVIRDRAPFSRWKSLELQLSGRNSRVENLLSSIIVFPNLESLVISRTTQLEVATIFCRGAMPKLKKLDLRAGDEWHWGNSLIRSLNGGQLSLPGSIITLHAVFREMHPFPNILNYKLQDCSFRKGAYYDLRSMTSFIVDGALYIAQGCEVLLPALQYLRLMAVAIHSEGKIEAPVLRTLHLSSALDRTDPLYTRRKNDYPRFMHHAVTSPGYRLSPKNLIISEPYLPKGPIIDILKKSRKLTHVTLCFDDRRSAQEVVKALFESTTGNASLDERLCPRLEELMLDWWDADIALSAEQWVSGLGGRKADPLGARVLVKARQTGEDRYRLLAEW